MIQRLEGKTVFAKASVHLACDGQAVFVAEGEAVNSRAHVVKVWPEMFTDQPPRVAVEDAI